MPSEDDAAMPTATVLDALHVRTESGQECSDPTLERMSELLIGLGWPRNQWLIVERVPNREEYFFQTFRTSAANYDVEIREGSEATHVATLAEGVQSVLDLLGSWHREDDAWRSAARWRPHQELDFRTALDPEMFEEAVEVARRILAEGFRPTWRDVASDLVDHFYDGDAGGPALVYAQAEEIVEPLWDEHAAEQRTWPERTDCDSLREAFAALDDEGIVARADFSCCNRCGHTEIGEYLTPGSTGYVFFHYQDTERAAEGGPLMLRYGAASDSSDPVAVGTRIVERVRAAGLPVEWNGDPGTTISVGPLQWRNRLPGTPGAVAWPGRR
ncbi:MAG: DUF6891 domain-containing protein [Catenulispora sp.]